MGDTFNGTRWLGYERLFIISMVFILDGNLEIGAHSWSAIGILICPGHLSLSRAVANLMFLLENSVFSYL